MTYEEYKESKNPKKNNIISSILSKLFTVIIFTMIVIILCNCNKTFKNFIINDVLNNSMNFSYTNKIIDKFTDIFKNNKTQVVFKEENKSEIYKDGIKYYSSNNSDVLLKDSGIVTYIGNKEGYGNTIIIQQSNGYYAWYGNVKESIKLYDYIESGEKIGTTVENYYYYVLYKDDKPITNES